MKIATLSTTGVLDSTTLKSDFLSGEANSVLIAQAVRVYRAAARQGTAKTKTRGEVNRTKKKWFKQKHTGNARHGARTPNIFVGGGVSHGPTGLQNWQLSMSQTMRRQALRSALISQSENVILADGFKGTNQAMRQALKPVVSEKTLTLLILPATDLTIIKALRNMPAVNIVTADRVTVMEVAVADRIVMTNEALTALENRVSGKGPAKTVAAEKTVVAPKTATPAKSAAKTVKKAPKAVKTAKKVAKPSTKK